jgi:hypothetical protein
MTSADRTSRAGAAARALAGVVALAAGGWATAWLLGRAATTVAGNHNAPWIVGRASGITAYVLLVAVTTVGLALSHPWRTRYRRPSTVARIRVHAVLATFALVFTVLHIVVLANDSYAGVGWQGALLPMGASYRPVPVTLGVIGLYSGLASGVTAALAGRLAARVWWPLHKVSALALVLVWLHGLFSGSDSAALLTLYVLSGAAVIALAVSRYTATTPADRVEQLAKGATATVTTPAAASGGLRRVS